MSVAEPPSKSNNLAAEPSYSSSSIETLLSSPQITPQLRSHLQKLKAARDAKLLNHTKKVQWEHDDLLSDEMLKIHYYTNMRCEQSDINVRASLGDRAYDDALSAMKDEKEREKARVKDIFRAKLEKRIGEIEEEEGGSRYEDWIRERVEEEVGKNKRERKEALMEGYAEIRKYWRCVRQEIWRKNREEEERGKREARKKWEEREEAEKEKARLEARDRLEEKMEEMRKEVENWAESEVEKAQVDPDYEPPNPEEEVILPPVPVKRRKWHLPGNPEWNPFFD